MNRTALIAAAIAATIGAGLLFLYMKRFEEEASGGLPVRVLIATQDIPLGAQITESMIAEHEIPSAYVEERHIRAEDAKRIIGIRVSMGIKANSSILWSDLATTSEQRRDLSGMVRNGMRAITVRASVNSAFGGLLRPGDRVDVMLTAEKPSHTGQTLDDRVTITILQNMLVLAVGRDVGAPQLNGKPQEIQNSQQVTLEARLDQSQVLTFAADRGQLTLVLRNPDDITILDNIGETMTRDILEPERRANLARREHAPAATPEIERVQ